MLRRNVKKETWEEIIIQLRKRTKNSSTITRDVKELGYYISRTFGANWMPIGKYTFKTWHRKRNGWILLKKTIINCHAS